MWIDPRQQEHGSEPDVAVAQFIWTAFALLLFGLGAYLFYLSFGQPDLNADLAARARLLGPFIMLVAALLKPRWILAAFVFFMNRLGRNRG